MKEKVAYFGVFTALALILGYVETFIPIQMGIPGIKLGLANLIIIIALFKTSVRQAYLLSVARVVLSGLMFGSMSSILYSMAGAVLSLTVMVCLKKSGKFSIIGMSVAGGVFHNVGQLIMAAIVLETLSVGYYFSVLLVAGIVAGMLIGIVAGEVLKRLNKIQI